MIFVAFLLGIVAHHASWYAARRGSEHVPWVVLVIASKWHSCKSLCRVYCAVMWRIMHMLHGMLLGMGPNTSRGSGRFALRAETLSAESSSERASAEPVRRKKPGDELLPPRIASPPRSPAPPSRPVLSDRLTSGLPFELVVLSRRLANGLALGEWLSRRLANGLALGEWLPRRLAHGLTCSCSSCGMLLPTEDCDDGADGRWGTSDSLSGSIASVDCSADPPAHRRRSQPTTMPREADVLTDRVSASRLSQSAKTKDRNSEPVCSEIFSRGWDSVNTFASPGPTWFHCVSCVSCVSRCVSCVSCV